MTKQINHENIDCIILPEKQNTLNSTKEKKGRKKVNIVLKAKKIFQLIPFTLIVEIIALILFYQSKMLAHKYLIWMVVTVFLSLISYILEMLSLFNEIFYRASIFFYIEADMIRILGLSIILSYQRSLFLQLYIFSLTKISISLREICVLFSIIFLYTNLYELSDQGGCKIIKCITLLFMTAHYLLSICCEYHSFCFDFKYLLISLICFSIFYLVKEGEILKYKKKTMYNFFLLWIKICTICFLYLNFWLILIYEKKLIIRI